MRLTKHRRTTRPEIDMTPMIDIVFLLIIFFMTVTQVSEANKERINLPKHAGTQDQERTTLTINVLSTGEMRISRRRVTIARVVSIVSREIGRFHGDTGRLTVVVRADETGRCRAVNDIVTALAGLGVTQIRFAVEVPQ